MRSSSLVAPSTISLAMMREAFKGLLADTEMSISSAAEQRDVLERSTDHVPQSASINTFATSGSFTIAATYANDTNFASSSNSVVQVVVTKPICTSANQSGATQGTFFSFHVTASGSPAPTFSISGKLPKGVTFSASTGILSGTPANGTAGSYVIRTTVTNTFGTTTQTFTLNVSGH